MSKRRKTTTGSVVNQTVGQKKIIGNSTQLVKQIGRGSYGRVFLAQQVQQPRLYFVVKCISMKYASDESIEKMEANLDVLKSLWSPYVVKMYAYLRTDQHMYLYFDYCEAGTLLGYMKDKKDPLSENETLIIFRQLIEGYRAMYDMNLLHRDIKPQNIMLHQGKVKLAGTAFSSVIFNVDFAVFRINNILSIYGSPQLHRGRTPEGSVIHQNHTNKTDVFSLGVVIFEMLYGRPPYPPKKYVKAVENFEQPPVDFSKPVRSKYIVEILRKMLAFEEKDRMSWEELFNHPVFNDMQRVVSLNWPTYADMIGAFHHYMTYNSVRGFYRIDINDINETPLDPSLPVSEFADRFSSSITIFKTIMRDRNQAFFYCMIAWVYYRCADTIPSFVNKHSQFQFVLMNKAIKTIRRLINLYFNNPDTPQGIQQNGWLEFKQTNQYDRERLLMYQDYTLLVKISEAIYQRIHESQVISNRVAAIVELTKKRIENQVFMKIYVDTMTEAIVELRKEKKISSPSLLLLNYMEKSFFPAHTFAGYSFDFYRFYEQQERRYGLTNLFMLADRKNQIILQIPKVLQQMAKSSIRSSTVQGVTTTTVSKVQQLTPIGTSRVVAPVLQVSQVGQQMSTSRMQQVSQVRQSSLMPAQIRPRSPIVREERSLSPGEVVVRQQQQQMWQPHPSQVMQQQQPMQQSNIQMPPMQQSTIRNSSMGVPPPQMPIRQSNLQQGSQPQRMSQMMQSPPQMPQQMSHIPPSPPMPPMPQMMPPQQMHYPQIPPPQQPMYPPQMQPQLQPPQQTYPMQQPQPPIPRGPPPPPHTNLYVQVPPPHYQQYRGPPTQPPPPHTIQQRYNNLPTPTVKQQSQSQASNVHQSVVSPGAPTYFKALTGASKRQQPPPSSQPSSPRSQPYS